VSRYGSWYPVAPRLTLEKHFTPTSSILYTTTRRLVLDELFHPNKDIELYLNEGIR